MPNIRENKSGQLINQGINMTNIETVIKDVDKQFGKGTLARAIDAKALHYERVTSGIQQFDYAIGGGVPLGRILEFSGPLSGGKTTFSLKIASEFQKAGKQVAFIDAEHSFDMGFAERIGVDLTDLIIAQTEDNEEAIDVIEMMVKSRAINLIILDSISSLVPLRVLEKSSEDVTMGIEAKLNNLLMRKVVTAMYGGDITDIINVPWCTLIIINQLRAKMSQYGTDEPGGGYGIKFFKSLAIDFRRTEHLGVKGEVIKKLNEEKYGQKIFFLVKKNKTSIPWKNGNVDFYYRDAEKFKAGQFDLGKELVEMAVQLEFIERRGYTYHYKKKKWVGKENLINDFNKNTELFEEIKTLIRERMNLG